MIKALIGVQVLYRCSAFIGVLCKVCAISCNSKNGSDLLGVWEPGVEIDMADRFYLLSDRFSLSLLKVCVQERYQTTLINSIFTFVYKLRHVIIEEDEMWYERET